MLCSNLVEVIHTVRAGHQAAVAYSGFRKEGTSRDAKGINVELPMVLRWVRCGRRHVWEGVSPLQRGWGMGGEILKFSSLRWYIFIHFTKVMKLEGLQ